MRIRPNEEQTAASSLDGPENDLYRALQRTFEHLLQPGDPDKNNLKNDSYVSNPEVERKLNNFFGSTTNASAFLIGPTGIGKSTVLRHTLKINRSPKIVDDTLYILFSLNPRSISDEAHLKSLIGAVLQECVWALKKGSTGYFDEADYEEMSQFLHNSSADVRNTGGLDLSKPTIERLKVLSSSEKHLFIFSQVALKYYAVKEGIARIVFIVDDLEGQPHDVQEFTFRNALITRDCLSNFGEELGPCVLLLISLRPETHAWLSLAACRT